MEVSFAKFIDFTSSEYLSLNINNMQTNRNIITATLIVIAAVSSLWLIHSNSNENEIILNQLDLTCGFTDDFSAFIKSANYSNWGFQRSDIECAAFGGKASSKDTIAKTPIIFIHGNSDIGFGKGSGGHESWQTGFRELAIFLGSQGYKKSELYTTTWGTASLSAASLNNHKRKYVLYLRAFVEAVLAYTKAPQVTLIGHSMGVTLGRKIAQGGSAFDIDGNYSVGPSLKNQIKSFIGIAGGNLGLTACFGQYLIPTCSDVDGFNPGASVVSNPSKYLHYLNTNAGAESRNIYSVWSTYDDVIGGGCLVWGKVTSRIAGQKDEVVKQSSNWNHFTLRDKCGPDIIKWL